MGSRHTFGPVLYPISLFPVLGMTNNETRISKHNLLCSAVLIMLMVVGGASYLKATTDHANLEFPRSWASFRDGSMTQTLEKAIDKTVGIRPYLISFANSIRYKLLNAGGEQVRAGKEHWLFLVDEIKYEGHLNGKPHDRIAALAARVDLIKSVDAHLQANNVKLVVALVPDKARIYGSKLSSTGYPSYNQQRYSDALSGLQSAQVKVVDLLTPLQAASKELDIYYKTDTHWNQTGADIAAKAIGESIKSLGLTLPNSTFITTSGSQAVERPGDLIRLMGLHNTPNGFRPTPDYEKVNTTTEAVSANNQAAASLFGDTQVPITLVGTSYSLRGNFHGALQQTISAKILNTAKDGGGFLQALTAYLKDDSFKSSKPNVLIWEIPERMLQSPLADERNWFSNNLK